MEEQDPNFTFDYKESKNKSRRGSVLFNLGSVYDGPPCKINKSDYEQVLLTETKQWHHLIKDQQQHLKNDKENPIRLDNSTLAPSQRIYADAAPNFDQFLSDSKQFLAKAELCLAMNADFQRKKADIMASVDYEFKCLADDILLENGLVALPKK